ncbi:DUF636 domain-containing protein, partial [Guyanagaster necrorhizus]
AVLWVYDKNWYSCRPELIHPFVGSVYLHSPRGVGICVKMNVKPDLVRLPEGDKEIYDDYGPLSLAKWHKKHNLC